MSSASAPLNEISVLLRAQPARLQDWLKHWRTQRVFWCAAIVIVGAGIYGGVMGAWRDALQALYTGIKLPLVILITTLGNTLLNGMLAPLLGVSLTFRQSLLMVLMTFAIAAVMLGALTPGNSMKTKMILSATAVFVATSALAQQYSIDWFTIDGGGGTSTGGIYSVSGTIGQPDASGAMTGGNYSLTGGFWPLPIGVPSPGSPTLLILRGAPGFATISWSPATSGFVLQTSDTLTAPNWSDAPSGAANPTTVPATLPSKFYRLRKP